MQFLRAQRALPEESTCGRIRQKKEKTSLAPKRQIEEPGFESIVNIRGCVSNFVGPSRLS